jgi:FXSXX-COOH protein
MIKVGFPARPLSDGGRMVSAERGDASAERLSDVTRLPLDRIVSGDDSALLNSLRRVLADIDRPQEVLSAFDNYAGDPGEPDPFTP